jgi:hypothetical protein
MKYTKFFALAALAAGMAFPAAAQDRDLRGDYARVNRMQADISRDRARMNEDIRYGRSAAAARDAADLARDQRALDAQMRDIHRDQRFRDWR